MTINAVKQDRPIWQIAIAIQSDWQKPYFGAVPYIRAMRSLNLITDKYGADDADMVVHYFLSNAKTWKGEVARTIKKELKKMIGEK